MDLKKIAGLLVFTCYLAVSGSAQVKVTKATNQKVTGGRGGTFMSYEVGLANSGKDSLVIDSVRTRADFKDLRFYVNSNEKAYTSISFGYALVKPEKCKVCPDVVPNQSNLTKGVIIYYHLGNKNSRLKVKKFKQLEDKLTP